MPLPIVPAPTTPTRFISMMTSPQQERRKASKSNTQSSTRLRLASGSRRILTAVKLRLSFTGDFTHIFCLSIKSTIRPHHTCYRLKVMQTGHRTGCKGRGSPSSVSTKSSGRQNMLGKVRMTALAIAVTLACSGLALANDHDNDKDD